MSNKQYAPVKTKRDFVRRYQNHEFGNRAPTWDTIEEFKKSDCKGLVHIRNRNAGGITFYDLTREEAIRRWSILEPKEFYISLMAPTKKTILQGELTISDSEGLTGLVTTVAKPMRIALAEKATQVRGVFVNALLRTMLCPNSYDWTMTLLDRYPGHVIEFTTFSCDWGTLPGFNTVWWEVRDF